MANLYQYAAYWEPNEKQEEDGGKAELVLEVETVLASSDQEATLIAARAIPDSYSTELDQVVVVVRPFERGAPEMGAYDFRSPSGGYIQADDKGYKLIGGNQPAFDWGVTTTDNTIRMTASNALSNA